MALTTLLESISPATMALALLTTSFLGILIHRAFLNPLKDVSGPFICRLTSLWTYYHSYIGDECRRINELHARYGPIVRIAPNEVCISDGGALAPIYNDKGGFLKAPCYTNFDIEGHSTIFSALDPSHRSVRSKAVLPMFSTTSLRTGNDEIEGCVKRFVERMKEERQAKGRPVNSLNLTRGLALDAVSSYLFGKPFGGITEGTERMSASSFVDALVAVGRFFFLPNWVFLLLETNRQRFLMGEEEKASAGKVSGFVDNIIASTAKEESTYQGRLRKSGISEHEIKIQCEDLIFAGTDSTGMNLATICWQLARNPEMYVRLCKDVASYDATDPNANPQSIPYLDAIIREGLRLSMANPTRLPRIVPAGGWTYTTPGSDPKSYHLLAGTQVGIQIYTLHTNPAVFPDPFSFKPERWLDGKTTSEMQRDWLPFGLGTRQCIARNLAMVELLLAVREVARSGVLEGARAVNGTREGGGIEIIEWFNSKVKGEKIEIAWD